MLGDEITVHSVAEDVLADHLELVDGARLQVVDFGPGTQRRIHIHRNPIVDATLPVPASFNYIQLITFIQLMSRNQSEDLDYIDVGIQFMS